MPKPISRRELIRRLHDFGFEGPFSGTRHAYMKKGGHKIFIPNPHGKDIGAPIARQIIHQLGISAEEWEQR